MVYFPKNLRPRRVDYRYSVEKHGGFSPVGTNSEMEGGYAYYDYIESYNRLYHYPELQEWYVYKTGLALDDDGNPMNVTDPRTGEQVPKFSYLNNSKPHIDEEIITFTTEWPETQDYYEWVQNWLFS
jgi:hypothetical protein